MKWEIRKHPVYGRCLYADDGSLEVGVLLDYGLRIGHFSFLGGRNVFFEQPDSMKDLSTEEGWRVRCGHRLWLAPESPLVYYPDNDPVAYEVGENEILVTQKEDPWLHVVKRMQISFGENCLYVTHLVENTGISSRKCALWAVSAMAPGGVEHIPLDLRDGGMDHWHRVSMWDYTSLGDERANYSRDEITLTHLPLDGKYKIGVGHPKEKVWYDNAGVSFIKHYEVIPEAEYPDGNVSYETFLCRHMVEMESLSPVRELKPGEAMEHTEKWELRYVDENQDACSCL